MTVFAAADARGLGANDVLAHRVSTALTVGAGMLVLALVLVVAVIVRPRGGTGVGAARRTAPRPVPAIDTPVPSVEDLARATLDQLAGLARSEPAHTFMTVR